MGELQITKNIRQRIELAIHRTLPPCKEIVKIVSASLDRKLTLREKIVMKLHVAACQPCSRYFEQSEVLQNATHQLDDKLKEDFFEGRLSDEARARIKNFLHSAEPVPDQE